MGILLVPGGTESKVSSLPINLSLPPSNTRGFVSSVFLFTPLSASSSIATMTLICTTRKWSGLFMLGLYPIETEREFELFINPLFAVSGNSFIPAFPKYCSCCHATRFSLAPSIACLLSLPRLASEQWQWIRNKTSCSF